MLKISDKVLQISSYKNIFTGNYLFKPPYISNHTALVSSRLDNSRVKNFREVYFMSSYGCNIWDIWKYLKEAEKQNKLPKNCDVIFCFPRQQTSQL